jgi:hypothetical protein
MFCWKKKGLLFSPQELNQRTWLKEFAQAPSTLVFDSFVRVYFSCRPAADKNGQYVSYSAFVDLDRKNLYRILGISKQPVLDLGQLGTFDEFGTYPFSVIRENDNVVAYYAGWTRCESVPFNVAIGRAISNNGGETFQRSGSGPVLSYSLNEPFVISGPKIRRYNGRYVLFYIAGSKWLIHNSRAEPVYRIRMAFSDDGLHWEKVDRNLIETRIDPLEAQASPDVIYKNGKYHMFFCYRYPTDYRNRERGYRIGYAYSEDLINWKRMDEKTGIDVSTAGWDSEMISYPHLLELDGKIYMFYLGNHVGRYGFGLAELDGQLK